MNYTPAYTLARQKFQACSLEDMERCSGYVREGSALVFTYLGRSYRLDYPSGIIKPVSAGEEELSLVRQILILHYAAGLKETLETGKLVTFKEFPGGALYQQAYQARAIDPLVRTFASDPARLLQVAALLGGEPNNLGDVGVTLRVFPRMPVLLVLWRGDEEFPAAGNILFDASAQALLPTEDYAALSGDLVFTLKRLNEGK